jgi:hypothetical protein
VRVGKGSGKAGKASELIVAGGARPKVRKPRVREWTRAREEKFLTTLAETCNVKLAAEAAGLSVSTAYDRRKTNAAFRAGWAEALASAYQRLELVLLDRALNGTEKVVTRRDGSEERMRDYSNPVALTLLRMHRETARETIEQPAEVDVAEVRQRLVEKLQRLRKRFEEEDKAAQ